MSQQNQNGSFKGTLISTVLMGLVLVVLFFVVKGFITLMYKFSLIFLILALVIDYKVVIDYGKQIFALLKREPLYGVGAIGLSAALYPFVFLILMIRAFFGKSLKNIGFENAGIFQNQEAESGDFDEYTEVIEEELELKEIHKHKRT